MTKAYCFNNYNSGLNGKPISTLGLLPGNQISAHAYFSSSTGAATGMSVQIEYYDSSGTLLSTTTGNTVNSTTTRTSSFIDGDTIPANTAYIAVAANYTAGGDTVYCDYGSLTPTPYHIVGAPSPSVDMSDVNHVNQLLYSYNSTPVQATVASSADTNGNYLSSGSTTQLTDDAGYSQSATWGLTSSTPTNIAGYGITDAQPILPLSTNIRQALFSDNGGSPYWADLYDANVNYGFATCPSFSTSSTSFTQWGPTLGFYNPGETVNILAYVNGYEVVASTSMVCSIELQYSTDGGSTWTAGQQTSVSVLTTAGDQQLSASVAVQGVTPTGDIQIKVMVKNNTASSITYTSATVWALLLPVSNYYTISPLVVTVPSTASMSCTSTYPTSTCTASANIKATPTGGVPAFTYSWAKVSGSGSITAGSTSQTCTVSDTETTTTGGATHTTTVKCTVTDSQVYPITTPFATWASSVATLTIGSHNIPVGASIVVAGITPSGYNGTFTVTAITTTTVSYALASNPGTYSSKTGTNQITSVSVTTSNCVDTGTFTLTYAAISPSLATTSGSCSTGSNPGTCTAGGTFTVSATGGNGSYTYSNTITSQTSGYSATITSGATSSSGIVQGSATTTPTPGNTDTVSLKTTVNDTRGTGAKTATNTLKLSYKYIV